MKFVRYSAYLIAAILTLLQSASTISAAEIEGVMMRNGKMMLMKHGKPAMPMEDDLTIANGTVVSADGTVKLKGGREFHMRNGQVMMTDGHLMKGGKASVMESGEGNPINRPMLKYPNQ
jgi:hypothetical protein